MRKRRSRPGFVKIDRHRFEQVRLRLVEVADTERQATDAQETLVRLYIAADHRTCEVRGSDREIAQNVARLSDKPFRKHCGLLVEVGLIRRRGVATNGNDIGGGWVVECAEWLSGVGDDDVESQAPPEPPAEVPAEVPAEELRRHTASTSGNEEEELKNARTQDNPPSSTSIEDDDQGGGGLDRFMDFLHFEFDRAEFPNEVQIVKLVSQRFEQGYTIDDLRFVCVDKWKGAEPPRSVSGALRQRLADLPEDSGRGRAEIADAEDWAARQSSRSDVRTGRAGTVEEHGESGIVEL